MVEIVLTLIGVTLALLCFAGLASLLIGSILYLVDLR